VREKGRKTAKKRPIWLNAKNPNTLQEFSAKASSLIAAAKVRESSGKSKRFLTNCIGWYCFGGKIWVLIKF
jgi:hypothetical protein